MSSAPYYLADPATQDWLVRIFNMAEADGSDLVMGLGTPNPKRRGVAGLSDNCRTADTILDWLVDNGWIKPLSYNPSREQRFFGVGGRAPGHTPRKAVWRGSHTYPQEWRFEVNRDSPDLVDFVRRCSPSG